MLSRRQLLALALPCLFVFAINAALRQDLVGADNYAFANVVCNNGKMPLGTPPLAAGIFNLLPCNLLLFKFLPAFLMLFCMIGLALAGNLLDKTHGWLAGFFLLLAPNFTGSFLVLEDDQFAFPILFFALYFFLASKTTKEKSEKYNALILSGTLIGLALLFWNGAILYALAFGFGEILFAIASIPILAIFWQRLLNTLLPNLNVAENLPLVAFGGWMFAFIGVLRLPKQVILVAWFWIILGILNMKYAFHAIPFFALGVMQLYVEIGRRFPSDLKRQQILRQSFTAFAIANLIALPIIVWRAEPTMEKKEAIVFGMAQSQALGKRLMNDWDLGYWIEWKGGVASAKGGQAKQFWADAVVLTRETLYRCERLATFGDIYAYNCP